jgi:hypothetical protein
MLSNIQPSPACMHACMHSNVTHPIGDGIAQKKLCGLGSGRDHLCAPSAKVKHRAPWTCTPTERRQDSQSSRQLARREPWPGRLLS